jgi:hypothetical protein
VATTGENPSPEKCVQATGYYRFPKLCWSTRPVCTIGSARLCQGHDNKAISQALRGLLSPRHPSPTGVEDYETGVWRHTFTDTADLLSKLEDALAMAADSLQPAPSRRRSSPVAA